jgi:hypothetical protein
MLCALLFALATESLVPFNDLGPAPYAYGYYGGLYEDGSNTIPADHLEAGLRRASLIQPLDANGKPSPDGKIVFLSAGYGETERITNAFAGIANSDYRVNRRALVIANAAREGYDAPSWFAPMATANFNRIRDQILTPAGVTEKQVQAAWIQMTTTEASPPLPRQDAVAYRVKGYIATALRNLKLRYPNLQVAYLSSRVYGGYANTEPYNYESALSVRWVILGQVTLIRTGFLWDTRIGDVNYETGSVPWVAWGPYFWANGTMPRSDGVTWERDDFGDDGATLSDKGARKAAMMLFEFMIQEPTAAHWFRTGGRIRAVRH